MFVYTYVVFCGRIQWTFVTLMACIQTSFQAVGLSTIRFLVDSRSFRGKQIRCLFYDNNAQSAAIFFIIIIIIIIIILYNHTQYSLDSKTFHESVDSHRHSASHAHHFEHVRSPLSLSITCSRFTVDLKPQSFTQFISIIDSTIDNSSSSRGR